MEGSFVSASIQPPADDGANPSSYPSWILLDNRARFADLDNATTMKAKASTGHEVKVTFCLAEPPAVSYCCVHCPETTEARVVSSANELVLLCVAFRTVPRSTEKDSHFLEYFVYKAASGGNQSIRTIPCSSPTYRDSWHAAILPCEGDHFLVADLVRNEDLVHYDLHMFSLETNEWSTTRLKLQTPPDVLPRNLPSQTDKVISLGGSMVGWVDLWCGILVCDVLEKEPGLRLIPLPKGDSDQQDRLVRDVMGFPNGLINFIEIEHCSKWFNFTKMRRFKTTSFLDFLDTIQDSEILSDDEMLVMDDGLKSVDDGWKIRTCFRSISSDHWRKRHIVHVDDISADTQHSVLVPQLWDSRARKCILRNLKTTAGIPTFSIYNDNVVCLKVASRDEDAWTIGVDLGKKKLEVIKPCCDASLDQTFLPCEFSEYLNTTPRPYVEEVAVDCAQTGAPNDHLLLSNTIPGADTAQTGVANNMQQNMNGDNYYGSYKQYGYGTYPGCGNFQQASPLQPPLTQAVQLMSSSARLEGFIYARLTEPDNCGRMSSVPLNEIYKPTTLSLPPPHRCLQCQGSHLWPNWCGPANPSRQQ